MMNSPAVSVGAASPHRAEQSRAEQTSAPGPDGADAQHSAAQTQYKHIHDKPHPNVHAQNRSEKQSRARHVRLASGQEA